MEQKSITLYPELIVDIAVYVVLAVVLILISKWIWEWKEERRLRKEFKDYMMKKEDEEN
ncbi:MAG: hypothetical protein IKK75_01735 [Clostridia bacterium]|nr:hypothetical protein [Clostridia bacterium]